MGKGLNLVAKLPCIQLFQLTLSDQIKLQPYATRPNGSVGRSRGLLHVLNTNQI